MKVGYLTVLLEVVADIRDVGAHLRNDNVILGERAEMK